MMIFAFHNQSSQKNTALPIKGKELDLNFQVCDDLLQLEDIQVGYFEAFVLFTPFLIEFAHAFLSLS